MVPSLRLQPKRKTHHRKDSKQPLTTHWWPYILRAVKHIIKAISALLIDPSVKRATCYVSKDHVVTAARVLKPKKRDRSSSFVVTTGKPNFRSRLFIKACK